MAKTLANQGFPTIKRIRQITDNHCGPAVVVMLASYIGIFVKQNDIVKAANVRESLDKRGMTVPEIGRGITSLRPECVFWSKSEATINDIDLLINKYNYPVGVEWQGAFGEYADEDNGHYSVVTSINIETNTIILSDPFYYFAGTDRSFPIDEFVTRWWDVNEISSTSGEIVFQKDIKTLFLVTTNIYEFPPELNLIKFG
jgi:hypothetical protein